MPYLILLFACASVSFGVTHGVEIGTSIDSTVAQCSDGDTVLIHDGVYTETTVLYGKSVVIASEFLLDLDSTHIGSTIIRPDSNRTDTVSCFVYAYGEDRRSRLIGLTIESGRGTRWGHQDQIAGGGVYSFLSAVTIEHCRFMNCEAQVGGGAAIVFPAFELHGLLTLDHCRFTRCFAEYYGGAVYAPFCSLRVNGCDFDSNQCGALGPGMWVDHADATIDSCRFAHGIGISGGLSFWECLGHVSNCLFEENSLYAQALEGACDLEVVRGNCTITGNHFRNNRTTQHSLTIDTDNRHPGYVVGNIFENLLAEVTTGTLSAAHGPSQIAYNVFRNNINRHGGVVYAYAGARPHIHHNVFDSNLSEDSTYGSVCVAVSGAQPTIDSNIIRGNSGQTITPFFNGPDSVNARNNWWGDVSGPYHPTLNPQGRGDTVLWVGVQFSPWLTAPPDTTFNTVNGSPPEVLSTWDILAVYPNPFNSAFHIAIAGFTTESFRMELFDLLGRRAALIQEGPLSSQIVTYRPPASVATGIYFLRVADRHHAQFRKLLFLK
ncbi:T9SS type A sorting domain-containing protein [candidate division KSB1 bacterium]|nr:T9SS type A sorting domain-containing protein [candidate division KSB1 bacterium]